MVLQPLLKSTAQACDSILSALCVPAPRGAASKPLSPPAGPWASAQPLACSLLDSRPFALPQPCPTQSHLHTCHHPPHPLPGRHLLILWDSMQRSCAGAQASLEESAAPPVPPPRPEPCPLTCFPLFAALRASRGRDTGKCLGKELGLPRAGVALKRSQGPSLYLPLRRTQRE